MKSNKIKGEGKKRTKRRRDIFTYGEKEIIRSYRAKTQRTETK